MSFKKVVQKYYFFVIYANFFKKILHNCGIFRNFAAG